MLMRGWCDYKLLLFSLLLFTSCASNKSLITGTTSGPPNDSDPLTMSFSEGVQDHNKRFETLGFQKGQQVPDVNLFSVDGSSFVLTKELKRGKPVMLISGSYTCDVARYNLPHIKKLKQQYGDKVDIFMVYTREAHPSNAPSPYSEKHEVWIPKLNIKDQVKADQPKTYGDRKVLAAKWRQQYNIELPILLDNPDNKFWLSFGQAPNFVYLIKPDGNVYFKQPWFKMDGVEKAVSELIN